MLQPRNLVQVRTIKQAEHSMCTASAARRVLAVTQAASRPAPPKRRRHLKPTAAAGLFAGTPLSSAAQLLSAGCCQRPRKPSKGLDSSRSQHNT